MSRIRARARDRSSTDACAGAPPSSSLACMSWLYSLYDALVSINVQADKARAVVDAMERGMLTQLASKSDLEILRVAGKSDVENLRLAVKADIDAMGLRVDALGREFRLEQEVLRSSMTIRLGSMLVVGLSVLFAALKLTGS